MTQSDPSSRSASAADGKGSAPATGATPFLSEDYVRRLQTPAEFYAAATSLVNALERELRRVKPRDRGQWRALELGCGPAHLMRPMSRHFAEINGVDVSQEMLARARANLDGVDNARLHLAHGTSLEDIDGGAMDFVYSYSVLSNLFSRTDVFESLLEVARILKPGGLARLHFNGLVKVESSAYDAWDGIRFSAGELLEFTARNGFQVLAVEGAGTPNLWTTWKRREEDWAENLVFTATERAEIRRITNTSGRDPVVPSRGRYASVAITAEGLPEEAGLHHLRVTVGGELAAVTYIGPRDESGGQVIHADLPDSDSTGLLPVQLHWTGWPSEISQPISDAAPVRVIAPGPSVPRIVSVADAANPSSIQRIETRRVKVTLEEAARLHELEVYLGGAPVEDLERVMTEVRPQRYEVTFHIPEQLAPGRHKLQMNLGQRRLAPVEVDVVA